MMKILQICKKFPFPLNDGESIAVTFLAKALHELGCELTLLAMNTSKHPFDLQHLPSSFNHYKAIHTVAVDNRVRPIGALISLLKGGNYFLSRFESDEFEAKLRELLDSTDFDVVQFETLQTLIYAKADIFKNHRAKIVLRSHNVEHEIWERLVRNAPASPKRWYLNHLTKKLKDFELSKIKEIDSLLAITQRDMDFFRASSYEGAGLVVPIGVEASHYTPDWTSFKGRPTMAFIGSMDWLPNSEGINWFIKNVLPHTPKMTLHLAGRNMSSELLQMKADNLLVHGEVPTASEFINQHSIMVVPLLSGSGMRVKILEGMALGRVIITTRIGAEGIPATDGEHFFIAETAEEFIEKINFCRANPEALRAMGWRARCFVLETFDNLAVGELVRKHYLIMKNKK